MKPVKSKPRFRCDYCQRVSTKEGMERHEMICWKNPDRYCTLCSNTGYVIEDHGPGMQDKFDCPFCQQYKPEYY